MAGMSTKDDVRAADEAFFSAMVTGDAESLKRLLTDDFVMVSVFDGARVTKGALASVIESGQLKLQTIDPAGDIQIRVFENAAVTNNELHLVGELQGKKLD